MKKLIALMMVFLFLFGCASTTLIKSNLPGAKLQVDGQVVEKRLNSIRIKQRLGQ